MLNDKGGKMASGQKIGWKTAMSLVIANMIGTGVFTSLGYQLVEVQNSWTIILLWLLGGVLALIGAFSYAELGTSFKESGGDYIFLSRLLHPFLGYLYAWVSLTVGFAAPVAIAALAMNQYLSPFGDFWSSSLLAVGVIISMSLLHSFSVRQSGWVQNLYTLVKALFVLALIGLGYYFLPYEGNAQEWGNAWQSEIWLPGFAVSLVYVTYAYTGWNSAAYIVEEIEEPARQLPKALIGGTVGVVVVYLLLHMVFLRQASVAQLSGEVEVATIAFTNVMGTGGAKWVSAFIAIQLLATISGYLWVGSRVTFAMAREHRLWAFLASQNARGVPARALWLQTIISILLLFSGTFEQVMLYAGFVLQLMGTLSILALLWLKRGPNTYASPFRPWAQIIYLLVSLWILGFMLYERPYESLIGLGIVLLGGLTYFVKR